MDFLDKALHYAGRLPEGIERTRDQIIGMSNVLEQCHPSLITSIPYATPGFLDPDRESRPR